MPTYHPALLLRNPSAKKDVWEDMKVGLSPLRQVNAGRAGTVDENGSAGPDGHVDEDENLILARTDTWTGTGT